jgi:hypothetical protein
MAYFRKLPDVLYPTLRNEKSSSFDYTRIKNLFKRAKIREDYLNVYTAFEKYTIIGDERPDNVAATYYNDSGLDWLILVLNNIQNVRTDWPMSQSDFYNYISQKYTDTELFEVRYHETKEVRNSFGELIIPAGLIVDENYSLTYLDNGVTTTYNQLLSVSNFEHENRINEEKRDIFLLRPILVDIVEKDLKQIFRYDRSSEYVNRTTIRTYNPRIR